MSFSRPRASCAPRIPKRGPFRGTRTKSSILIKISASPATRASSCVIKRDERSSFIHEGGSLWCCFLKETRPREMIMRSENARMWHTIYDKLSSTLSLSLCSVASLFPPPCFLYFFFTWPGIFIVVLCCRAFRDITINFLERERDSETLSVRSSPFFFSCCI